MKRYDFGYVIGSYTSANEMTERPEGEWVEYDSIPRPTLAAVEAAKDVVSSELNPAFESMSALALAREILRLAGEGE